MSVSRDVYAAPTANTYCHVHIVLLPRDTEAEVFQDDRPFSRRDGMHAEVIDMQFTVADGGYTSYSEGRYTGAALFSVYGVNERWLTL
jgi:hypothetical protein